MKVKNSDILFIFILVMISVITGFDDREQVSINFLCYATGWAFRSFIAWCD